jgi:multisubunit Na+/H+ antiporter MnhE subunit
MTNDSLSALIFIVGLVISTIIIYLTTKLFGQKEGIGRAFVTALIGTVIYFVVYYILHFWQRTPIRSSRRHNLANSA